MSARVAKAARAGISGAFTLLAVACSGADATGVTTERSAIVGGSASTASEDAVVLLLHVASTGESEQCTGTLLAPNLVLTARHCVSDADLRVLCTEDGKADVGGSIARDYDASELHVFAGTSRPQKGDPGVAGKHVVTTGATNLCDQDIALVVLAEDVHDARIAPVRLGPPSVGEKVAVVGWGLTSDGTLPSTRQSRAGVDVRAVGPATRLGPGEFRVGQGSCAGDSGGPALATSGAVVGVLSRGGAGAPPDAGLVETCETGENVYTELGAKEGLLRDAYALAGAPVWREGEPEPRRPPHGEGASGDGGGCATTPFPPMAEVPLTVLGVCALLAWRARSAAGRKRVVVEHGLPRRVRRRPAS